MTPLKSILGFYWESGRWHWTWLQTLPNGSFTLIEQSYAVDQNPEDPFLTAIEILSQLKTRLPKDHLGVIIGIPSHLVSFQSLQLPFTQKYQIQKVLPFELEEKLPFDPNEAQITFLHYPTGSQSQVVVASALKERLEKWFQPIHGLNLPLKASIPLNLALHNALWPESLVRQPQLEESPPTIVDVYVGYRNTLINLVKSGALCHAASFEVGIEPIYKALKIQSKSQLSQINLYRQIGQKLVLDESSNQSWLRELEKWIDHLNWVLLSWLPYLPESGWEVRLSGEIVNIVGIHLYLTQKLQVPVNWINLSGLWPQYAFENIPDGAEGVEILSFGLALEGLRKSNIARWQLLFEPYVTDDQFLRVFWEKYRPFLWIPTATWLIVAIGLTAESWVWQWSLEKQRETITAELKNHFGNRISTSLLQKETTKMAQNWRQFKSLLQENQQPDALTAFYQFIQALDKKPSQGPVVQSIQAQPGELMVTLTDPQMVSQIQKIRQQLETTKAFQSVQIVNSGPQQATLKLKVL